MALNSYLSITGAKQGQFKSGVTQKGREDQILVFQTAHEIVSPRDPASGLPTGKRMHKPFEILKDVDKSTPLLYNALVNNEQLNTWKLQYYRPDAKSATEKQYYTVTLTNASVCGVEAVMPNNKIAETMKFAEQETWKFVYQKIEWTWMDGGITSGDDWEAPVV